MRSVLMAIWTMLVVLVFVVIVIVFVWCSILIRQPVYISECEQIVNHILSDTAKSIKKKYKIRPSGEGASMPSCVVRKLYLAFTVEGSYNQDKLRGLLIAFAEELLNNIIINKEIQPFLIKTPFTIENVEITIYNHDKNNREIYDPEIAVASIFEGVITYKTVDINKPLGYKHRYHETYEEALKLLAEQNDKTPGKG